MQEQMQKYFVTEEELLQLLRSKLPDALRVEFDKHLAKATALDKRIVQRDLDYSQYFFLQRTGDVHGNRS